MGPDGAHLEIHFDRYGDWCIAGRDGHIFADGKAYLIVVMTGAPSPWFTGLYGNLCGQCTAFVKAN
jgi:hypothetical protein